jgi:glycosyltransferase involved in cell wall biosynthesis
LNQAERVSARPSISAFFPAYNDAGTIGSMVIATDRLLRQLTDDYEIIVVNDGSTDHTREVLAELEPKYPALRVIDHVKNRGYGGALKTGFSSATKDLVFYTDGDAQYDVDELALLVPEMIDGVDVVNGFKISRSDPLVRIIIGRIYHWTVKIAFLLRVRDVDCDFRLIRRCVFRKVSLEGNSGIICVEMVRKFQAAGFKIAEVPVHHYHRTYGRSQFFNFRRVGRTLRDLIGLWWRLMVLSRLPMGSRQASMSEGEVPGEPARLSGTQR